MSLAFVSLAALAVSPVMAADSPPHLDTSGVNMQPAYPASALAASERGAVVVGVHVNGAGRVAYAFPLQTSGFADLDSAAIAGVMGWRFVPASSDGKNVEGDSAVEIVFQPPEPPNASAAPAADPPKPIGDFLAKSFEIDAKRGEYEKKDGAVPCASGTLRSTLEFQHSNGSAGWGWAPVASLKVESGKDQYVTLQMVGHEWITPPLERFVMWRHQNKDQGALGYSHTTPLGGAQTVSLSWDANGLVTATVGAMETHQAQLPGPPTQFSFAMSSGKARFVDSALVCTPASAGR